MTHRRSYGNGHAPDTHEPDDWQARALCAKHDDPGLWFPDGHSPAAASPAKRICCACPVLIPCLRDAMAEEDDAPPRLRHGIRGGHTHLERWQLWRRHAQPRTAAS